MSQDLKKHKSYQDIKDFLRFTDYLPNSVANGTYAWADEDRIYARVTKHICHNSFNLNGYTKEKSLIIGTGIHTHKSNFEIAKDFINWCFDPLTSPWRIIVCDKSNYELIYGDDGIIRGVIFAPYIFNSVDWRFIRNFCVALRFTQEYNNQLEAWRIIREAGFDPRDAYILVRNLITDRQGNLLYHVRYGGHNGSHWPLTSQVNEYKFDWNKYWNGEISDNPPGTYNGFFNSSEGIDLFSLDYGLGGSAVFDKYREWKKRNNLS